MVEMKIVMATNNRHKVEEIKVLFRFPGLEWLTAGDFPEVPEAVEDGDTFEANAAKKARHLALATGLWSLADDSGLEVKALGWAPGVHSARYAGEPCDHARNNEKLLRELAGVKDREARFRCVAALCDPKGRVEWVSGTCPGRIIEEKRGAAGFGYDPLFVPEGEESTFAEMGNEAKNRLSHRGRAMRAAVEKWGALLASGAKGFGA